MVLRLFVLLLALSMLAYAAWYGKTTINDPSIEVVLKVVNLVIVACIAYGGIAMVVAAFRSGGVLARKDLTT